jgi:hypothetical protein
MNTIKYLSLALLSIIFINQSATCQTPPSESVSGELKYLQAENGKVFLAINSDKKLMAKGDDGSLCSSKLLQLVIADPELGKKAMSLIGKRVTSKGQTMARHTQHHHTEVLWVVSSLDEALNDKKETPEQGEEPPQQLKPRSVEW